MGMKTNTNGNISQATTRPAGCLRRIKVSAERAVTAIKRKYTTAKT
jgi:hypothetical protein